MLDDIDGLIADIDGLIADIDRRAPSLEAGATHLSLSSAVGQNSSVMFVALLSMRTTVENRAQTSHCRARTTESRLQYNFRV